MYIIKFKMFNKDFYSKGQMEKWLFANYPNFVICDNLLYENTLEAIHGNRLAYIEHYPEE